MDPLLSTLILILLALLGARFSFSSIPVPQGPRLLLRTGVHFLFVGFALGPHGLNLLGAEQVQQLFPLLALGLGWVGFLFGLQLDRSALSQFPRSWIWITIVQGVLTFAIFFGIGWVGLAVFGWADDVGFLLVSGAAATAAVSAPAGVALVSSNFLVRGNVRTLLFFIASLDGIVGIVALQLTYAVFHPAGIVMTGERVAVPWAPAAALFLGLAVGIVFLWLNRPRPHKDALVLFLLGMAAFSAGAALRLQLSPLFVSAVLGIVVANLAPDSQRIYRVLQAWEQPVYLVFLILAGAFLSFSTIWVLPLGAAYFLARTAGKMGGTLAATRLLSAGFPTPRRMGEGLVTQGGMSVALALSAVLSYQGFQSGQANTETFFTIVVLGVVLSDLAGPLLTTDVLRRAGEISPHVEAALAQGDQAGATTAAIRHTPTGPANLPERSGPE
mgnify:CR=1 FL=1